MSRGVSFRGEPRKWVKGSIVRQFQAVMRIVEPKGRVEHVSAARAGSIGPWTGGQAIMFSQRVSKRAPNNMMDTLNITVGLPHGNMAENVVDFRTAVTGSHSRLTE